LNTRIHVKPSGEVALKTSDGEPVPAEGENYEDSSWWRRRERDGDAVISKSKPKSKKQKGSDK
jgi:Protein of unknown function (DUF2635)